jgi:hypothetical protein
MADGNSPKKLKIFLPFAVLLFVGVIILQRFSLKNQIEDLKSRLNVERLNASSLQTQIILAQAAAAEEKIQRVEELSIFIMRTYSNSEFNFSLDFPEVWNFREEKPESGPLKFSLVINSPAGYNYFVEIYELQNKTPREFIVSYYPAQGYKVLDLKEENLSGKKVIRFYTEHSSKDVRGLPYSYGNIALQRGDYLFNLSSSRGRTPEEKMNNPFLENMVLTLRLE